MDKYKDTMHRGGCKYIICTAIMCFFVVGCGTIAEDNATQYTTEKSYNYVIEDEQLCIEGDNFLLSSPLTIFHHTEENKEEYFASFSDRTENSLNFIRDYIKEYAPECYDEERFEKFVNIQLHDDNTSYYYELTDGEIVLHSGSYFVHRDVVYVLALMNPMFVEWQHFGMFWYLGTTINPYTEIFGIVGHEGGDISGAAYCDNYIKHGGHLENLTNEDIKILYDCVAYHCLTYGYNWGSPSESGPVYNELYYNVPKKFQKKENEISPFMATSFTAWLATNYGFDSVANHCFKTMSFEEAYGVDYQTAYDAWADYILSTYSE